jgi:hypothetical protein
MLITRHRTVNWLAAIVLFFFFGMTAFWSLIVGAIAESLVVGVVAFAILGVPQLVFLILHLAVKVEVVTVFGQRMRVRMRFWLRKRRANEVFDEVCRIARQTQESQRRSAMAAAPVGGEPLLPSEPARSLEPGPAPAP